MWYLHVELFVVLFAAELVDPSIIVMRRAKRNKEMSAAFTGRGPSPRGGGALFDSAETRRVEV